MTIIVTGAAGFVGRLLVARLLAEGEHVSVLDRNVEALRPHARLRALAGDLADPTHRSQLLAGGCTALVHLATVPGGAAEADPQASRRINLDAMYDLLLEVAQAGTRPRIVYASSIAVLGEPLPKEGVNDATPVAPRLIYGGHKAMMEVALTMMTQRGMVDGVTVRLPGILARPKGPSGMKSAFMSDLFHALREGSPFVCPVSPDATIWAQSVDRCVDNFRHGLQLDASGMPSNRAVTLPAIRIRIGDLVEEIADQCSVTPGLVSYIPDPELEAAFGAYPALSTPAADRAGFQHDGTVARLVERALARIATAVD